MRNGALSGLTVIAIEQAVAAPYCTARLADAGARVIKIERSSGETARHYDKTVYGVSAYFVWLNRGKESIVLNLKAEDDLALLGRMLSKADILIQNLVPGALERMGLGAARLRSLYPSLISVGIVGYGQDTPYAQRRAYDMLVQAETGLCAVTGTEEKMSKVGVSVADIATGMNAHAAILEALIERSRSGTGKAIEIAMFDSVADWMNVPLLHLVYGQRATKRAGLAHASIYPYGLFQCLDGEIVIVAQNPDEWGRFCDEVLRQPKLKSNPRYIDNPSRVANRVALHAEIEAILARLTTAEATTRLDAAKLAWSGVSSVAELAHHPALRAVEGIAGGQVFRMAAPPLHPESSARAVPGLNQHGATIRAEFA